MNAKDKIEELALKVAMEALAPGVPLEVRVEALKILNPHYTMLLKSKAKDEPPTEGGFDFDAFNRETENADAGTQVGGHTRRGAGARGGLIPS
jgi:hypothetical protein